MIARTRSARFYAPAIDGTSDIRCRFYALETSSPAIGPIDIRPRRVAAAIGRRGRRADDVVASEKVPGNERRHHDRERARGRTHQRVRAVWPSPGFVDTPEGAKMRQE